MYVERNIAFMYIREIIWDDYRIEHVARHDVDPHEVEEACDDPYHTARRQGKSRYRLYGQASSGRYLFVVLERMENNEFRPITARDMTQSEKQGLRKRKK